MACCGAAAMLQEVASCGVSARAWACDMLCVVHFEVSEWKLWHALGQGHAELVTLQQQCKLLEFLSS